MIKKVAFLFFLVAILVATRESTAYAVGGGSDYQDGYQDDSNIERRDTKDEAEAEMLVAKLLEAAAAEDKAKAEGGKSGTQNDQNSQPDNEENQRRRRFIWGTVHRILGLFTGGR